MKNGFSKILAERWTNPKRPLPAKMFNVQKRKSSIHENIRIWTIETDHLGHLDIHLKKGRVQTTWIVQTSIPQKYLRERKISNLFWKFKRANFENNWEKYIIHMNHRHTRVELSIKCIFRHILHLIENYNRNSIHFNDYYCEDFVWGEDDQNHLRFTIENRPQLLHSNLQHWNSCSTRTFYSDRWNTRNSGHFSAVGGRLPVDSVSETRVESSPTSAAFPQLQHESAGRRLCHFSSNRHFMMDHYSSWT